MIDKKREDDKNNNINENIIIGRNSVLEALKSGRELDNIIIAKGTPYSGTTAVIISKAKEKGITVKEADARKMDYMCGHGNHQGVVAYAAMKEYSQLDDIFATAKERGEDPFIVILDEIEDPHNLGAIIRTAECAGVHGVIIPKRRSSGLTYTVHKASAGALEYMHIVKITNIASTIDKIKDMGVWVYGTDMNGESIYKTNLKGSIALVIGNEGKGIGKLVESKCDGIVSLPMYGKINSLNASVAAGIAMYEAAKQRN